MFRTLSFIAVRQQHYYVRVLIPFGSTTANKLVYNHLCYIGKVAKIWASSKNGPYSETIQRVGLLKCLVWLAVELDL